MKNLLILLLFSNPFFGLTQNIDSVYTKFSLGNLQTQRVSLKEFKKQTNFTYPKNLSLDSVNIYFFIPSLNGVRLLPIYPNFDTLKYKIRINELTVGSTVTIDFYLNDTINNKSSKQTIHYNISTLENNVTTTSENLQWKELTERTYLDGTIYISNPPMHDVIIYSVKTGNPEQLKKLLGFLVPGGIVTFDRVNFKDKLGKTGFLNESVKIK